tara:strand:- start:14898 stop:15080 length:183 start_codon:yes stop_codon:yes gene_type:complete
LNIIQSEILAYIGFENAAGLFFSKKAWPDHANGYITKGISGTRYHKKFENTIQEKAIVKI